jgi:hypothetical protein
MNHSDSAAALFSQGLSCSQAVFSEYAGEYGLDKDAASKIASGFGGGMGRMGLTCGAVTGAYIVIGFDIPVLACARGLIYTLRRGGKLCPACLPFWGT